MTLEHIEKKATEILKRNTVEPAKRINAAVKKETDVWNKPGTLVAETLKEGVRLPIENVAHITKWTIGKMGQALKGTVSLGLSAASHLPIPLPGGFKSPAEFRAHLANRKDALRETIHLRTHGDNRSFSAIFDEAVSIRERTQKTATGSTEPSGAANGSNGSGRG